MSLQDNEIRSNAALYLPQISELLNRVPRQMLLLLKTNDLLRGIETTLQTRASSSSFLNMSRCCIRALARSHQVLCYVSYHKCMFTAETVQGQWLRVHSEPEGFCHSPRSVTLMYMTEPLLHCNSVLTHDYLSKYEAKWIYWVSTQSHEGQQNLLEEQVKYSINWLEVNMKHCHISNELMA